uniref:CSON003180 protein n=1 Tax=Culicoides sonorensis TaxID=179676 RepID=A0A336KHH7_CULSO
MKVVKDTVEYREKNDVKRNDFMDLLLNLKNSVNEEERLTLNEIAAQAFVFFLAGFETSSTAMSYALYELAQNQKMQEKARKSIYDALKNHNNEITYESVNEMAYIDHCINGEGPRVCIGLRFGMLQARIGLALLLKHFKFTMSEKTEVPLTFSPESPVLTPKMHFLTYICLITLAAYLWMRKRFKYWSDRGIPCPKITFPLGTLQTGKHRVHASLSTSRHYQEFQKKSPICGQFFTIKPAILALDINLIKNILTKDFTHFHDRGVYFDETLDPLSAHLFNLEGQRWKSLRSKLTPTFSSGKMKFMFSTMIGVGQEFIKTLSDERRVTDEIEIRDFAARFTTDIIGTCAFGLECNSLKDPDTEFRLMGKKVFLPPKNNRIKMFLAMSYKKLGKLLKYRVIREEVTNFFMKVVQDTVQYRETHKIKRNDFMDLLLNLKNTANETERLTFNEIAAQSFVFWIAGFETSSTVMSFALYELALNQEIQDKARTSVVNVLKEHDDELNYESLSEMTYLDYCINGEGPRFCIGNRFGLQQTKIGLALLLKHYKFSLSPKTKTPLVFSTKSIILSPVDGIWLKFEQI